jgi:excinuclease ABC subunit B
MQTIGRAARNVNAKVMLYADRVTVSMQNAIDETMRRRALQQAYNVEHGITPETVRKTIKSGIESQAAAHAEANRAVGRSDEAEYITEEYIQELEGEMLAAAESLEFERAASLRDRISQLRDSIGRKRNEVEVHATREKRGKRRGRSSGTGGRVPRPKRG